MTLLFAIGIGFLVSSTFIAVVLSVASARAREHEDEADCWQDQLWLDEQTQERRKPAEMATYDFTGGEHA